MSERDGAAGRGWIIDVDGCLVRTVRTGGAGGVPIDGAAEFLDELERRGERYIVCTNASELTPEEYAQNLRALGLPALVLPWYPALRLPINLARSAYALSGARRYRRCADRGGAAQWGFYRRITGGGGAKVGAAATSATKAR